MSLQSPYRSETPMQVFGLSKREFMFSIKIDETMATICTNHKCTVDTGNTERQK